MDRGLARPDHAGLLDRAFSWLKAHTWAQDELNYLSPNDLHALAADLGITEADLVDVLPRAADNSFLMDRMMEARGLDPDKVRHSLSALVRDLELVCTRCASAGRCRRDLEAGTAAVHCHEYCGNADTFDDLLKEAPAA